MPRLGKGSKSSFQMENHPPWLGFYPGIHFIKRMVLFLSCLVGWAGYHSRGIFNQCLLSSSIWHQTDRSNNRSPSGFHSHDQTACFSTQKRFHNGTWQDPFQIMSWCCPNSSLNSAIINLRQTFSDLNCVEWILDIFFSGSFNLRATFCKRWVIAPTLRSWIERRTQDRYGLGLSKLAQVRFSWVPLPGGKSSTDWKCSTQN